jgi:glycosyltransferase involved in cell wall biosynthesis
MCGCTPVSTDCPTGPREVSQGGKYGFLVPMNDPENMPTAILAALKKAITSEEIEKVIRPFTENHVIKIHRVIVDF